MNEMKNRDVATS